MTKGRSKTIKPWKHLSSKRLIDHPDLKVDEDTVLLPNGRKTNYVRHAPSKLDAVIVIAQNKDGKILLQQEYSYPPNQVLWQFPGGSMNKGESITDAALRELAEESGYSARKTEYLGYFFAHNRYSNRKQHIVVCHELYEKHLAPDADEFIETYWRTQDEIDSMISTNEIQNINLLAALMIWSRKSGFKN